MRAVHIVHTRIIDAAPVEVGALLDGLGSEADRLWPAGRWAPDMRVRFDGPLAEGVSGGHGSIHYTVDDYHPGPRLWFHFDDPGLVGRHGFDVIAADDGRTRLVDTLEGRLEGPTLLAWPLIRPMHDAYVEDIFDQAELSSTGRVRQAARQPLWLRMWNGFDRRRQRWVPSARLAPVSGATVAARLAAGAVIHAAWALGWRWPGGSDQAFADRVVGPGADLPSAGATWGVVALLAVAIGAVRMTATSDGALPRVATWGVAMVLGLRGVIGVVTDFTGGFDDIYEHLDLAIYSPLCLALAVGAAMVAQRSFVRSRPWSPAVVGPAAPDRSDGSLPAPRAAGLPIRL